MNHLIADTLEELHEFAKLLGMKREWFHDRKHCPHYDVCESKRTKAIKLGVKPIGRRELVAFMHERRKTAC